MSTIKTNKIENIAGTCSVDVCDLVNSGITFGHIDTGGAYGRRYWTKFPDGTGVCYGTFNTDTVNNIASGETISLSIVYIETPIVTLSANTNGSSAANSGVSVHGFAIDGISGITNVKSIYNEGGVSGPANMTIQYYAIGRWK